MSKTGAVYVEIGAQRWRAGPEQHDLSIPLAFDGAQPSFFGAAPASAKVLRAGSFVGDVRAGGSCNCASYSLTPHCNGTHTECVGHITGEPLSVRDAYRSPLHVALLVTVDPVRAADTSETSTPAPRPDDRLVTRAALASAADKLQFTGFTALVVRTTPNDESKLHRNYDRAPAPFFSAEAMRWIVAAGIEHLVTDLPSLDRADDEGRLTAHRIFWNVAPGSVETTHATRVHATVTELAYVPNTLADGPYLLNLQIAPFVADAAPSRPVLLPLRPL
jgi:kynurenine formamidase